MAPCQSTRPQANSRTFFASDGAATAHFKILDLVLHHSEFLITCSSFSEKPSILTDISSFFAWFEEIIFVMNRKSFCNELTSLSSFSAVYLIIFICRHCCLCSSLSSLFLFFLGSGLFGVDLVGNAPFLRNRTVTNKDPEIDAMRDPVATRCGSRRREQDLLTMSQKTQGPIKGLGMQIRRLDKVERSVEKLETPREVENGQKLQGECEQLK